MYGLAAAMLLFSMFIDTHLDAHPVQVSKNIGFFWQVTDFHYDANYTLHGDPSRMCHYSSSGVHYDLGVYGDYLCDSPWSLVLSSISAMSTIHPKPDFILWTGDSVPHVDGSTYDEDKIFSIIRNVTEALMSRFPDTQILPSFGNHDPYPSNQMPVDDAHYYSSILNVSQWARLIPPTAVSTFHKGGYYSYVISPMIKIISLNTALYYSSNNLTVISNDYDPTGQFAWFASELEKSQLAGQKVYISAHVPPGTFELAPTFKWFHDDLNAKFLDIVDAYSEVIAGHFYGHEHTDSFRLYSSDKGGSSAMFLSPAVTPWKSSIPGVDANNPSIRLYVYDKSTSDILDYYQYYLNLTQANQGSASWRLEYQFTTAYDVVDLSPSSVRQAAKNIVDGDDKRYLSRYVRYNSVSAAGDKVCNKSCLNNHKCAILTLRYEQLARCLSPNHHKHTTSTTTAAPHHHHKGKVPRYMTWIIGSLAIALVLLAIIVAVLCFRSRQYVLINRGYSRMNSYGSIAPSK